MAPLWGQSAGNGNRKVVAKIEDNGVVKHDGTAYGNVAFFGADVLRSGRHVAVFKFIQAELMICNVGVVDATVEAKRREHSRTVAWAFCTKGFMRELSDPVETAGIDGKELVKAGTGSTVRLTIDMDQHKMLVSVDGAADVDSGFELPGAVKLWCSMYMTGHAVQLVSLSKAAGASDTESTCRSPNKSPDGKTASVASTAMASLWGQSADNGHRKVVAKIEDNGVVKHDGTDYGDVAFFGADVLRSGRHVAVFKFIQADSGLYDVGVVDATVEAKRREHSRTVAWAFCKKGFMRELSDPVETQGRDGKELATAGTGSTVRLTIDMDQHKMLVSVDGAADVDSGFELPGAVKLWCSMYRPGDAVQLVSLSKAAAASDTESTCRSPKKTSSAFCGSCYACNFKTRQPGTNCKFGSKCTRKDCFYAHASPAGTNHMAGSISTACRSGIQCTSSTCSFAHPSKCLVCTMESDSSKSQGAKDSNDKSLSSDRTALLDFIVEKLNKSPAGLAASVLGSDVNKKFQMPAGGLKMFCLDHEDKIKWIPEGSGKIQLVKKGSIPVGAKVTITAKEPSYGWGDARSWSVGTVRSFTGTTYIIDFPESKGWKGEESDLAVSSGVDRSLQDIGTLDPAFDKFGFVRNHGGGKFEFSGTSTMNCGRGLWEYGFVRATNQLAPSQSYFEMTIIKHRSDGVGIGLSGESFFAGGMVGWDADSIGFHSDDGNFFYKLGENTGNLSISFGKPSEEGDTLGCGVLFESDKPKAIYFCVNKKIIGRFPLRSDDALTLFPVVTGGSPAIVQIDLMAAPPAIEMACVLKSFAYEAKYNDSSNKFKPVIIKGQPNSKGQTPVNFKGYHDTVWIPQERLRRTENARSQEFTSLDQAFQSAADGDVIEIKDCGIHLMRETIDIKTDITVKADDLSASKPTICLGRGVVFKTHAKILLQNLSVKSLGGDVSKAFEAGGAGAVWMQSGNLSIASCRLASDEGSAVWLSDQGQLEHFNIEASVIGPCGRHGLIFNRCDQEIVVKDVELKDIKICALAGNGGQVVAKNCSITNCQTGLIFHGSDKNSCTFSLQHSSICNCTESAVKVATSGVAGRMVSLTECKIDKCNIAVTSIGASAKVLVDKATSITNCEEEQNVEDNGKIVKSLVVEGLQEKQGLPEEKSPTQDKNSSSSVSAETTNFARYCRLLMDLGRETLMTIFMESYRKEEGVQWEESLGPTFLSAKFPDGNSQRKLGKHLVDSIRSGNCNKWDITLLSLLLAVKPGYLKGDARKAVESLREERNKLAHSADLLARQSLTEEQFQSKWKTVADALKVLICLMPNEQVSWMSKIGMIAKEEMGKSALEPLFERVQEDMRRIQDVAEDAREKADEAMKIASGAARMSQVEAHVAGVMEATIESLFNKHGQVDGDRLPREVILSNQKRYRLVKQVGKGGMGTVFQAKLIAPDSDGGKLALKICESDSSGRAEREADILKRLSELNHENIVKFLDSALNGSHLVIIMELIEGKSLQDWLEDRYQDGGPGITFADTQPIVRQLVQGMSAIHAEDVAHRDLKPGNLVFDEVTGKLVIVDFGLSKQHNTNSTVTGANSQLGTLLYMSPEQLHGDAKEISYPADVWAIGVVWHEMLTNFTPFEPAATPAHANSSSSSKRRTFSKLEEVTMLAKVLETGPRKLPMLDGGKAPMPIIGIIAKCLYADKKDRYTDAQKLLQHMESVFEELEEKGAGTACDEVKSFKFWSVSEVATLIRSIGSAFADNADAMEANGIDGEYFSDMLANEDEDLTTSIKDGGLGFKGLQLKRVLKEIAKHT